VSAYNPTVPVVFGLDAGHTDPQLILPLGGLVEVDSQNRRIYLVY
jgi:muramoyltetrapeptide carboxypeptidase LdcA involved in peptidoglycan recycling